MKLWDGWAQDSTRRPIDARAIIARAIGDSVGQLAGLGGCRMSTMSVRFRNGILQADPPLELPRIGGYVRQLIRKCEGGTCLPWYATSPLTRRPVKLSNGLSAGTVFGPVHDVEDSRQECGLISVLVPSPYAMLPAGECDHLPPLIWINVYTKSNRGAAASHFFCEPVSEDEQNSWYRSGWMDTWSARTRQQPAAPEQSDAASSWQGQPVAPEMRDDSGPRELERIAWARVLAEPERRFGEDGKLYTFQEFVEFWGNEALEAWLDSAPQ